MVGIKSGPTKTNLHRYPESTRGFLSDYQEAKKDFPRFISMVFAPNLSGVKRLKSDARSFVNPVHTLL